MKKLSQHIQESFQETNIQKEETIVENLGTETSVEETETTTEIERTTEE